jgi:hypothetical protein
VCQTSPTNAHDRVLSLQEKSTLDRQGYVNREVFRVNGTHSGGGKKVGKGRCIASVLHGKRVCSSGCKKRKRAHPNMVSVHE